MEYRGVAGSLRVEGALVAWAASTQCAGGQGWTAAGKEEEEELEDK